MSSDFSDTGRIDRILENALRLQAQGAHDTAIHMLRSALAEDPDHPGAHTLLAVSLMHKKRLYAAESEARMALSLDPALAGAHQVLAAVLIGGRKLKEARAHLDEARTLDPENASVLVTLARLAIIEDDRVHARSLLDEARALDPDDIDVVVALGDLALLQRNLDDADERAREALELEPDGVASHVLAGQVALARGRDDDAREHAVQALRGDPTHGEALQLLAGVRAKRSLLLGLWWRYHASVAHLGETRLVFVLIAGFVVIRLLVIALRHMGNEGGADFAENLWLAWCVYTWVGPALFQRALDKELESVKLHKDF